MGSRALPLIPKEAFLSNFNILFISFLKYRIEIDVNLLGCDSIVYDLSNNWPFAKIGLVTKKL